MPLWDFFKAPLGVLRCSFEGPLLVPQEVAEKKGEAKEHVTKGIHVRNGCPLEGPLRVLCGSFEGPSMLPQRAGEKKKEERTMSLLGFT